MVILWCRYRPPDTSTTVKMPKKANIFESFSHSAIQQFKEVGIHFIFRTILLKRQNNKCHLTLAIRCELNICFQILLMKLVQDLNDVVAGLRHHGHGQGRSALRQRSHRRLRRPWKADRLWRGPGEHNRCRDVQWIRKKESEGTFLAARISIKFWYAHNLSTCWANCDNFGQTCKIQEFVTFCGLRRINSIFFQNKFVNSIAWTKLRI